MDGMVRPIPRPSYSFLDASSRGESGGASPSDDDVRGVLGVEPDLDDTEELSSPSLPSVSTATALIGWDTAAENCKAGGRVFKGLLAGEIERSAGGGVILTMGDVTALLPLNTELLSPPRLQEVAESDLEGALFWPSVVPPDKTEVKLGDVEALEY